MVEGNTTTTRWIYGFAYFGLTSGFILLHLMPTEIWPNGIPGPDLAIGITFAWVLRRPQYVPTLLIAAVFLVGDFLFMRPLGLWTALVVLAVEFLRAREVRLRERAFPAEWAMVAVTLAVIVVANGLILSLFLVEQSRVGLTLLQLLVTIFAYPLIVLLSRWPFGVTGMTPGETDAKGRPR